MAIDLVFSMICVLVIAIVIILIIFLLLSFTCGLKRSGRQLGGLFVLCAPPGEGKTYLATYYALEAMKKGRTVYSNYPIKSVDGKYTTKVWKKELIKENISKSMVIADEIYRDYFSRSFKNFGEEDALDFSTLGQREVSFYAVSQSPLSFDVHIQRVTNLFIDVRKIEVPFLNMPLYFQVNVYTSLIEMQNAPFHPDLEPYDSYKIWFDKDVAQAYDTKYFAQDIRKIYQGEDWDEYYARQDPPVIWDPPKDIALKSKIQKKIVNTKLYKFMLEKLECLIIKVVKKFDKKI